MSANTTLCPVCKEHMPRPIRAITIPCCAQCEKDHDAMVAIAQQDHAGNDDIAIDPDAKLSRSDEGVWVAAWVWVPQERIPSRLRTQPFTAEEK